MLIKYQRPICLGAIIAGKRPEACNGCTLQVEAVNVTENYSGNVVIPANTPDLLQELQDVYDVAQNTTDLRRRLACEMLLDMSDTIIAHLVNTRKTLTSCSTYRRTQPENT